MVLVENTSHGLSLSVYVKLNCSIRVFCGARSVAKALLLLRQIVLTLVEEEQGRLGCRARARRRVRCIITAL